MIRKLAAILSVLLIVSCASAPAGSDTYVVGQKVAVEGTEGGLGEPELRRFTKMIGRNRDGYRTNENDRYIGFPELVTAEFTTFMDTFLENDESYLFHCHAGKNRTVLEQL